MKPLIIHIKRRTKVPTKRQLVYQYRYDYKPVGKITYEDSRRLFKTVGGGPIETDAQLAYLMYKVWSRDIQPSGIPKGEIWILEFLVCGINT